MKENRWIDLERIEIPEIRKPGFQSHVLDREVWEPGEEAAQRTETQIYSDDTDQTTLESSTQFVKEPPRPVDGAAQTGAQRAPRCRILLTRVSSGKHAVIEVEDRPYTIGKSRKADYVIDGNPSISRIHAVIYRAGDHYYLEDKGSLNHTYVDEEMITAPYRLRDGLVVRFADEDFILRMS